MKMETFITRIEHGKVNNHIYAKDGLEGLVMIWKHNGSYVVTFEECADGKQYDESTYTRDERSVFGSCSDAIQYLQGRGIEPETFTP